MLILLSSVIPYTHNTSLAVAAIVVSIVAAITGLALMNNIRLLPESRRKALIVMAAFLLGGGIWSMHFLAMLSIEFPVPIHYDLLQTLSSGLIAVLVVGFALLLLHFQERTHFVLNTAGLCLGVGIILMHIVGMLGMRGVVPQFNTVALAIAFAFALLMGVAAVRVSYGSRSRQNIVKGGVLFGLSVVVVHHTAMVATYFSVDPDYQKLSIALDQSALAIVVTVTVFIICGTFLLAASTFVPGSTSTDVSMANDPTAQPPADPETPRSDLLQQRAFRASGEILVSDKGLAPVEASDSHGSHGSRDSHDTHDISDSSHSPDPPLIDSSASNTEYPQSSAESVARGGYLVAIKVPYEQQKQIFFVDSADVGAIRADGRYTQLYTRDGVKFCPWSITEAQKRLDDAGFYRSHRSYLVNMAAVVSFEKQRDSGVCRFEGFSQLSNVPVSRSRVGELVSELGLKQERESRPAKTSSRS